MEVRQLNSDELVKNIAHILPHLERVLNLIDSGYTEDDVITKLQLTEMQIWCVDNWRALAITQITIMPQHKILSILYTVGADLDAWLSTLVVELEKYAKLEKCKYVEFFGRKGWLKKAKPLGFDDVFTVMRLSVDG